MTAASPIDLGTRSFSLAEQRAFGAVSHDRNPMHVDPVAARRLLTGRPVVHGIHTLLTALERWVPGPDAGLPQVECLFAQPINVDETVSFRQVEAAPGTTVIEARVGDTLCTRVELRSGGAASVSPALPAAAPDDGGATLIPLDAPLEAGADQHVGRTYLLPDWAAGIDAGFPNVAARFGAGFAGALAGLSYVVGMVCPGLHSVFSSLKFSADPAFRDRPLRVHVMRHEPRFRLVRLAFDGPISGEVQAFERARPQPQPTAQDLAGQVDARRFSGLRAVVVGGSRGLGELTAKLLGVGGADVTLTFASGQADAQAVADSINAVARGRAEIRRCDLEADADLAALSRPRPPDAVYFFATPRIYRKGSAVFDREAFDQFADFYLARFAALCLSLEQAAGDGPVRVYLPSTVFIDERPKGLTAYAMVKAAAEVLAEDLNRSLRKVRIVHSRLPRLATDQTAGTRGLDVAANVDVLRAVLESMHPA